MLTQTTRTTRTTRPWPALLVLLATLSACQARPRAEFDRIQLGMAQAQVKDVLGPPSSTWPAPPPVPGGPETNWSTRWQWGDTLSTAATSAVFADQPPPPRVGVIWFDAQGHVVAVRAPDLQPLDRRDPWAAPPR